MLKPVLYSSQGLKTLPIIGIVPTVPKVKNLSYNMHRAYGSRD